MLQQTALGILKTGRNVYLTGAAGAGKTHVLNQYIAYLREHGVGVAVTASTGIAATHINGMTIHSWSGIGVKDYLSDYELDALGQRQHLVRRFEKTDVLIIDEVSMLAPHTLDMVDAVCRELKRTPEAFGGMQVVFAGDFFQLPPVVRGSSDVQFADSAQSWQAADIRTCYLTEQYRQQDDPLVDILNDIRDGEVTARSRTLLAERAMPAPEDAHAVLLFTHNENVDARNAQELHHITGTSATYDMTHTGRAALVASLTKGVLAPERLELKVGAQVMFVKNDPERQFANGTLGEVVAIDGAYPVVETHDGRRITAEPMTWEIVEDGKVRASVTQIPLRLAWAITVHKSQGMSLDTVEIDLSRAFVAGQGYVALSRARTLDGLYLREFNETALQMNPYVCELDARLREVSDKWEHIFTQFSDEKVTALQKAFIDAVGGRMSTSDSTEESLPTHLKTVALLTEGTTVEHIADARGLTVGTVLMHLEKLRTAGHDALDVLRPEETFLDEVREAYKQARTTKLPEIHRRLQGRYTFEELRLARLFIE